MVKNHSSLANFLFNHSLNTFLVVIQQWTYDKEPCIQQEMKPSAATTWATYGKEPLR